MAKRDPLKALAFQLATQLPADTKEAYRVVGYLSDLIAYGAEKPPIHHHKPIRAIDGQKSSLLRFPGGVG